MEKETQLQKQLSQALSEVTLPVETLFTMSSALEEKNAAREKIILVIQVVTKLQDQETAPFIYSTSVHCLMELVKQVFASDDNPVDDVVMQAAQTVAEDIVKEALHRARPEATVNLSEFQS